MTRLVLRAILALAPRSFRERYGDELLEVHERRAGAARGVAQRVTLAVTEIGGALGMLVRARRHTNGEGGDVMTVFRSLRHGLRMVRRHPGYAGASVAVLALGIGATAAIFSAVNAYFFRPLPFGDEARLVALYETNPEFGWTDTEAAPANLLDWRERVEAFEDIAAYSDFTSQVTYLQEGEPVLLSIATVTGNFFEVLGARAALGRTFEWDETWSGRDDVVVLSHATWVGRFGADAGVVGRTIEFGTTSVEVVGVMPPDFRFPGTGIDLWSPWGWNPEARSEVWFRRAHFVRPVARLVPGVSHEQADAEFQAVVASLQTEYPETNRVMGAGMAPLRSFLIRDVRGPLLLLQAAVLVLLALACVNVANLALVRAVGRSREVSLRRALGAKGTGLAGQLLAESLVLAVLGGSIGLVLGWVGVQSLERLIPLGIAGATSVALDLRVVATMAALAMACGLVFGLAPLARLRGFALADALRDGERGGSARLGVTRLLVGTEVALAVLLVVGAGLMVRTFQSLRQVDPGFRTEGVLAVQFTTPSSRYADRDAVLAFQDEFLRRLEARPGIERAGIVGGLPLDGPSWSSQFQAEGWPPERVGLEILHRRADRGYFDALGIPLVRGRMFDGTESPSGPRVVVINERFAEEHFPGEDPIGQRIAYDRAATPESTWREIIGIVGDQHQVSPGEPARAEVFEHRKQDWSRSPWVVVRTSGDADAVLPTVRSVLAELDPLIPLAASRPLRQVWRTSMAREELMLTLLGVFGGVALVLAMVGVYGVTAQAAGRRRRELGIRVALGADRGSIIGLVLRQGMAAVVGGLVVGLALSLAASRALATYLHGVAPNDPATLAGVAGLLALAGLLACWLPARRATRLDPSDSLRAEG